MESPNQAMIVALKAIRDRADSILKNVFQTLASLREMHAAE
jgi:hypothetical protein